VKRYVPIFAAAFLLALPVVASALDGGPTPITINDDFFAPDRATRDFENGPSFHWSRQLGAVDQHNVRQDDKLFRSGNPTTGPIEFSVDASAGSFHYYCEIHGSPNGGMDGVIKVRPLLTEPFTVNEFDTFGVEWADGSTTTGSLFDVRYRIGSSKWKIWKNDTSKTHATFGNNNKPAKVVPGKTYKVEARSEKANTDKRSGWSPALSYQLTGP
jgi:hypothetical protein